MNIRNAERLAWVVTWIVVLGFMAGGLVPDPRASLNGRRWTAEPVPAPILDFPHAAPVDYVAVPPADVVDWGELTVEPGYEEITP